MNILSKTTLAAALLAVLIAPLVAPAQPETKPEAAAPADDRHAPLPNNFGKIAVSDDQRVKLYAIQDEYEVKIDALQEQIKGLIRERDAKMEEELTAGQKLRLKELREEARQKAAKAREATPPAAGAPSNR